MILSYHGRMLLRLALLLFLCGLPRLVAQTTVSPSVVDLFAAGDDYFLHVVALPGVGGNRTRTFVLYGLTHALLDFRRTDNDRFAASGGLYVEGIDRDGVIGGYGNGGDTVRVDDYRATLSRSALLPGVIPLALDPGSYTFGYSVEAGRGSVGTFSGVTDTIDIPRFGDDVATFGTPIFLGSPRPGTSPDQMIAVNADGDLPFGKRLRALITATVPGRPFRLNWQLVGIDEAGDLETIVDRGEGRTLSENSIVVDEIRPVDGELRVMMRELGTSEAARAWIVEGTTGDLPAGTYQLQLELTAESGTYRDTASFNVRWIDRPLSLGDPRYAIAALGPIATEEEIDRLAGVGASEQRAALDAWWKLQDPTPATSFNEKMTAYYGRIDYAYFSFATIGRPDGAASDRGRIYVLYGPPTDIERRLDPEGPAREIWTYENRVARRFHFIDRDETGAYRLVEYYDL